MMPNRSTLQLAKFIFVGSFAALIHFSVLIITVSYFSITPAWANVIAFSIAFLASFFGHITVTFRDSHLKNTTFIMRRLIKWLMSSLSGFMLGQGLFVLGLSWLGDDYYVIIWFIVTGLVTVLSFLLGKFWAFK